MSAGESWHAHGHLMSAEQEQLVSNPHSLYPFISLPPKGGVITERCKFILKAK